MIPVQTVKTGSVNVKLASAVQWQRSTVGTKIKVLSEKCKAGSLWVLHSSGLVPLWVVRCRLQVICSSSVDGEEREISWVVCKVARVVNVVDCFVDCGVRQLQCVAYHVAPWARLIDFTAIVDACEFLKYPLQIMGFQTAAHGPEPTPRDFCSRNSAESFCTLGKWV